MKTLGVFLLLIICSSMNGQSIKDLKWQKRVVILTGSTNAVKEALIIYNDHEGIEERRLVFLVEEQDGLKDHISNKKYTKAGFIKESDKFYLIGLDGGLKLKQKKYLSQKELFQIIDSMPMRANETRKGNE